MRKTAAQSLLEVTVGVVIFIPIVLALIDLSLIIYAVQRNESVCRNAAHSAAAGEPASANVRAQIVIAEENKSGNQMVSNFSLLNPVSVKLFSMPGTKQDLLTERQINQGGPIQGTVKVETEVAVRPFVLHAIYGGKSPLRFQAQQTFPIKYVLPPQPVATETEPD